MLYTPSTAQPVAEAIRAAKDLRCLDLSANTLGVDAAKVIGDALADHPEFERAHWKDLFTGRLKTEIPEALVCDTYVMCVCVLCCCVMLSDDFWCCIWSSMDMNLHLFSYLFVS